MACGQRLNGTPTLGVTLPDRSPTRQRDGVTSSPLIRLAVLDLAGTTVRDDGAVEAAFVFTHLLVGNADQLGELRLRHSQRMTIRTNVSRFLPIA